MVPGCHGPAKQPPHDSAAIDFDKVVSNAEPLGWSDDGLAAVQAKIASLGAAAALMVTSDEVVLRHGDLAKNYRAHSIRKSFLSALYGIAIDAGQIDPTWNLRDLGIDERTPLSRSEKQATITDLLSCRSGVYLPAASEVASARKSRPERHQFEPGAQWHYNNWDHNVLGTIYGQETGQDLFEAFETQIAVPLGMQDYRLSNTRYQLEEVSLHPSYKFRMSTRDLARFGMLFLHKGAWQGHRILSEEWVSRSTRPHSITGRGGSKGAYGLMWWVSADENGNPPTSDLASAFTASGTGGHRLTVMPRIDTVFVLRTDTDDRNSPRIGSSTYDRLLDLVLSARLASSANRDLAVGEDGE